MLTKRQRINKQTKRLLQAVLRHKGPGVPVFIFGAQRSGTNMLLYSLGRSWHTEVINETDPEVFTRCVIDDQARISNVTSKSRANAVFIKAICDSQNARTLLNALRHSKAIWLYRSYHDVVNSALRQFSHPTKELKRMASGSIDAGWLGENVSQENRSLLRRHLDAGVTDESARALMWYVRNSLYFEQSLNQDNRVILFPYDELVSEPERAFTILCRFAGIPYEPKIIARIKSSSIRKHPPPPLDNEVEKLCRSMYERLNDAHDSQRAVELSPDN